MTPINPADLGAKASQFYDLITMALDDPSFGSNPVPLNRQNLQRLFETTFDQ
jgi:alcohol dehydrogenase class IV